MTRAVRALLLVSLAAAPLAAQHGGIGPLFGMADYREVSASLRYDGVGPGVRGVFTYHRISAEGVAVWLQMTPQAGAQAVQSFQMVQLDGWLKWQALDHLTFDVGFTSRSPDAEFAAQSLGAVRVGLGTQYGLGHGAAVSLRGDYLAGAQFSGGGTAPLALELGLGLDVAFSRHVRATFDYSFERVDRKTTPGGGAEVKVPIQQALARVGVAVGL